MVLNQFLRKVVDVVGAETIDIAKFLGLSLDEIKNVRRKLCEKLANEQRRNVQEPFDRCSVIENMEYLDVELLIPTGNFFKYKLFYTMENVSHLIIRG